MSKDEAIKWEDMPGKVCRAPKMGAFAYLESLEAQANDMHALVKEMETHQRRKRMEAQYGRIDFYGHFPPIPDRSNDWEAYFERELDYDMPSWARGFGATQAEALNELLTQAEEHYRAGMDAKYQENLQQRAGC